MVSARRLYLTAAALGGVAAACLVVGLLRRHDVADGLGLIEGAYLNRSIGKPSYSAVFGGDMLDPFHPLNAYLWLGAAAAFSLAAVILLILTRLSSR
jgi:hypothetical protein